VFFAGERDGKYQRRFNKMAKKSVLLMVALLCLLSVSLLAEKIVVTYANWNLGLQIENRIIEEFEKAHPDIDVQLAENMDYANYLDSLAAAAAAGKLPDVIMIPNIPLALTNEWALNIADMVADDPQWQKVPAPIREATEYGNGVYAIPAGMYFMGYFVNDDLFDTYNQPRLDFGPTWQQFYSAVRQLTIPAEKVLGLAEEVQIPEWYPAALNSDFSWFTWDGEKYNLAGSEFINAVRLAKQIFNSRYVFDALSPEQKEEMNAGWYGELWDQGKIAIRWAGTWDINNFKNLPFNTRFIGVPGGRLPVVGDFMVISRTASNPEAAYAFARYVTFGLDGIEKRMEIDEKVEWVSMPLTTDEEVLQKYFEFRKAYVGLKEAYDGIGNGIIEGVKIVPGYVASRWTAPTGLKIGDNENANIGDVIWQAMRGPVNISDYAAQLNELANREYEKAAEVIAQLTD